MRFIAFLLIVAGLVVGTVSASTAYLVDLDRARTAAEAGSPLVLNAPAGRVTLEDDPATPRDEREAPLVTGGTTLSLEVIGDLEAQDVDRVRVKSFAFGRWRERWWFIGAIAGLFAGAMLMRAGREETVVADAGGERVGPEDLLAEADAALTKLLGELGGSETAQHQLETIVRRVGQLQGGVLTNFVETRGAIVSAIGMSGYARVMDAFAGAERQINRAWSAAADGVLEESLDCLRTGAERLSDARQRLEDALARAGGDRPGGGAGRSVTPGVAADETP